MIVGILSAILGPLAKTLTNIFSIFVLTPITTIFSYFLYRTAAQTPGVAAAKAP
jgi:hypothetical protein